MTETLDLVIGLVAGHFIGDFLMQTKAMALNKHRVTVLLLHCLLVAAITWVVCGVWTLWVLPLAVFVSHLLIDGIKSLSGQQGPGAYLVDQGVHLLALVAIGCYLVPAEATPFWLTWIPGYLQGLVLLSGAISAVLTGGFCVEKTMAPYATHVSSLLDGLPNAGRLIGQLERGLIFLLVMAGRPEGVGFLVAAKSILRFGEIKDAGQRKEAEYIIIGTLMSFGWALLLSMLTLKVLAVVGSAG